MQVTLSPAERQILFNQYEILQKLDPENTNDYKHKQEILHDGYAVLYDEVVQVWDEMDVKEGDYVVGVLDMHRGLKQSFEALEDKEGLKESDIEYQGFDGNNESKRLGLATFFGREGKWTELNLELNSHSRTTIDTYPPMLARWREIIHANLGTRYLTASQIKQVIEWEAEQ